MDPNGPRIDDLEETLEDLGGEKAGEAEAAVGNEFFVSKKAAAVLKHEILRQYVLPFASKVGSTARNSRVCYLDGYAGPGRYVDGTSGSPDLALKTAVEISGRRNLHCYFIEKEKASFEMLSALVGEAIEKGLSAEARKGKAKDHLDYVLDQANGAPLLVFLDPFGLGLDFEDLTKKIYGSARLQGYGAEFATDVLLNFSANAVRRIGGYLKSDKEFQRKAATLDAMDLACGGAWWRQKILDSENYGEAVEGIATEFAERACKAANTYGWTVAVRNRKHHQPVYHLVFMTRTMHGVWLFGESNSLAQARWRHEIALLGSDATGAAPFNQEQFDEGEHERAETWIQEIKNNIESLLETSGEFKVADSHTEVMGSVIDEARKMHIRAAVKRLYVEGKTSCDGKGAVEDFVITPR
jgi:three-Cys-motif partner protein